jgi:hypothetical protein
LPEPFIDKRSPSLTSTPILRGDLRVGGSRVGQTFFCKMAVVVGREPPFQGTGLPVDTGSAMKMGYGHFGCLKPATVALSNVEPRDGTICVLICLL